MESTETQSDRTIRPSSQSGRTWFPILLGVLCGIIVGWIGCFLTPLLVHSFVFDFLEGIFNDTGPCKVFDTRAYRFLLFTEMYVLPAIGGSLGVLLSRCAEGQVYCSCWRLFW